MEELGVTAFGGIFDGRKVFITGHTGFKGSWLTLLLEMLGAEVFGYALRPLAGSHFEQLDLAVTSCFGDIRDAEMVHRTMRDFEPDVVLHLAAQPLVRESYRQPVETWVTNVLGTQNVLEAVRDIPSIQGVLCVTTDKVYRNDERGIPFKEEDPLGGHDPYSASKAACEILIDSYRSSFFNAEDQPLVASVRAGNVIGGGDWAADRLVPDLVRAMIASDTAAIRNPVAVRPWQHVLDCLTAYLVIVTNLVEGNAEFSRAWNIGPRRDDVLTVEEVIRYLQSSLSQIRYNVVEDDTYREAKYLALDSEALNEASTWQGVWTASEAIERTADWYANFVFDRRVNSVDDIRSFFQDARRQKVGWIA